MIVIAREMKKIVQINSVVNTGSTGHIAEDIGKLAIENEFESYIAYGRISRESSSTLIKIGNKLSFYFHVLLTRFFDLHGLGSYLATKKFTKELDSIKPDIIHLHNIHGYYINYKVLFNYLANKSIPVVWTLHDCWTFTGHCSHFTFVNCGDWKQNCVCCPQRMSYPKSFLDNSKYNFKSKKKYFTCVKNINFVIPSHWLADQVKSSFLKGYPVTVINNGINIDIFKPCCEKSEKCLILGVAGVWDQRKGLDDFIKLAKLISDQEEILLIGLSKNQIDKLPLNVKGIERTESQKELAEWYSKATVFVNPTYEDTFPTTNLEALACGTPVITYKGTGSVETIDDSTGIVVNTGDIKAVYEAICEIRKNGKNYYSNACRIRAEKLFNKNKNLMGYINLYKKLVK